MRDTSCLEETENCPVGTYFLSGNDGPADQICPNIHVSMLDREDSRERWLLTSKKKRHLDHYFLKKIFSKPTVPSFIESREIQSSFLDTLVGCFLSLQK